MLFLTYCTSYDKDSTAAENHTCTYMVRNIIMQYVWVFLIFLLQEKSDRYLFNSRIKCSEKTKIITHTHKNRKGAYY